MDCSNFKFHEYIVIERDVQLGFETTKIMLTTFSLTIYPDGFTHTLHAEQSFYSQYFTFTIVNSNLQTKIIFQVLMSSKTMRAAHLSFATAVRQS